MIAPLLNRSSFAGALLFGALLAGGLLVANPPGAAAAGDTCVESGGVAVVVDFTDLGGNIEIGCAPSDPDSGRAALDAAGFVAADSQSGLLCAINSMPDPCPTTFQGAFWSYWHSTPDGEWTSYQVGADASDPVPGELEGWRYNDGTTGPGIAPADVQLSSATPTTAPNDTVPGAAVDGVLLATTIGFAAIVAILIIVFTVRVRGRRKSGSN